MGNTDLQIKVRISFSFQKKAKLTLAEIFTDIRKYFEVQAVIYSKDGGSLVFSALTAKAKRPHSDGEKPLQPSSMRMWGFFICRYWIEKTMPLCSSAAKDRAYIAKERNEK